MIHQSHFCVLSKRIERFFFKKYLFMYLFLAASALSCSMQCLLLQSAGFSLFVARRLSNCGAWAQ